MLLSASLWRYPVFRSVGQRLLSPRTMATIATSPSSATMPPAVGSKLHGRDFYRALGEPRFIIAPMVDRSEFAWRMLTRSYLDTETSQKLLAYTPMIHARLFSAGVRFRDEHFQPTRSSLEKSVSRPSEPSQPFLDGNPQLDRPLFVQFCANKPDELLSAAEYVAPYCDAVDLNLGCPQGIAKSGHYGAFLQEDWDTIYKMINTLHKSLSIPITAKMRILDTKEKTLEYAKMIISAGASILTVHGRRREQKGHNTGLADWEMIRYLRDNLPPETVLFANGNILNGSDLDTCLRATGADGVMSAEGNLSDPTIFAKPLPLSDESAREYWRSPTVEGVGGYRLDGVFRRYMDIIYKYVLETEAPVRTPLWIPGDPTTDLSRPEREEEEDVETKGPPTKKRKKDSTALASPNIRVIQGHLFGLLKPILNKHTEIRDVLAKTRTGDFKGFEKILGMVEDAIKKALQEERERDHGSDTAPVTDETLPDSEKATFSQRTVAKYSRPWWVAQPYIRPLPEEAIALGSVTVSSKQKAKIKATLAENANVNDGAVSRNEASESKELQTPTCESKSEAPKSALVCG